MEKNNVPFVVIIRNEHGRLTASEYSSQELSVLADFLTFEIGSNDMVFGFFLDWLKGKYNQKEAEGNAYGLVEYKGKILAYLQPHICGKKPYGKNPSITFSTSKEEMLNIMRDWAYTVSQMPKPNTILVTQEGESIKFTVQD